MLRWQYGVDDMKLQGKSPGRLLVRRRLCAVGGSARFSARLGCTRMRAWGRLWGPDGREAEPPLRLLFNCTFRSFYFCLKNIWLFFTFLTYVGEIVVSPLPGPRPAPCCVCHAPELSRALPAPPAPWPSLVGCCPVSPRTAGCQL